MSPSPGSRDHGDVERVREASDIVTVIGRYLALHPKGSEFVALCPFHDDRKPSMTVSPKKEIYKCFACGAGGDVFSFIQQYHGMDFGEALRHLAEEAGIELRPRRDAGAGRPNADAGAGAVRKSDLLEASAQAQEFFQAILEHDEHGAAARALIERRGISDEMVEQFGLGASPDRFDGLLLTINQRHWSLDAHAAAGLVKARESGGHYDALRHRLTFPIHDQSGRVVAFGGRRIRDEDDPKYLNSPESPLFSKGRVLYGLFQATREIKRSRRAVVVEGYTDVIACHQHGHRNVVAALGTALTADHARVLRRLCDEIVLLFDGDAAGKKAAERAAAVFFGETVDVRIATLSSVTDAKDPDELLARPGGDAVLASAFDRAVDVLEFLFAGARDELQDAGPAGRARLIDGFIRQLADLGLATVPPMQRSQVVRRLMELTGADWNTVVGVINAHRGTPGRGSSGVDPDGVPGPDAPPDLLPPRERRAREDVLACLLARPALALDRAGELTGELGDMLAPDAYRDPILGVIASAIAECLHRDEAPSLPTVLNTLSRHADQATADSAKARAVALESLASDRSGDDPDRLGDALSDALERLAAVALDARLAAETDPIDRLRLRQSYQQRFGRNATAIPRPGSGP